MPPSSPSPLPTGDDLMAEAGLALFRLGRALGRPPARRLLADRAGHGVELSRVLLVQALAQATATPGPTVGTMADRLGVDPSTASRLVSEAIAEGLVARAAAERDGRRVPLTLTDAGRALAEDATAYQSAVFELVTGDWPERERRAFARRFVRFAEALVATKGEGPSPARDGGSDPEAPGDSEQPSA